MKYSIVVPAYNAENYIEKCLDSIFESTYKNYEIIVINDGSTDSTDKIINKYLKKYNNIIYINQKNKGLSEARNAGIKKATGDYLIFVDSDDYIDRKLLSKINSKLKSDIDIVRYDLKVKYDDSIEEYPSEKFNEIDGISAFEKIVRFNYIEMAQLYAINRQFFINNKFKFKKDVYHEDYGLIPLVIASAKKVKSIGYVGYYYVQRQGSIMSSNDIDKTKKKMDDMLSLFSDAMIYLNKINNSQVVRNFYVNSVMTKYISLPNNLKKEYKVKIKNIDIMKYYSNNNLKRKIKRIFYKICYGI